MLSRPITVNAHLIGLRTNGRLNPSLIKALANTCSIVCYATMSSLGCLEVGVETYHEDLDTS
jgi:hypothetical protein